MRIATSRRDTASVRTTARHYGEASAEVASCSTGCSSGCCSRRVVRLVFRPRIERRGAHPATGPAILVSNHISAGDTFVLPAMIRRRLTFPAKAELFAGRGPRRPDRGLVPDAASGSCRWTAPVAGPAPTSMDGVLEVLRAANCSASTPRAPGRRTAGSTRARPGSRGWCCRPACRWSRSAMVDTQFVPSRLLGIPTMRRPEIRVGAAAGLQPLRRRGQRPRRAALGHRRDHGRRACSCPARPTSTRTGPR